MDYARARELLERERTRIERGLRGLSSGPSDEPSKTGESLGDEAADLADAELDAGLSDDFRVELAAVERAEQRLRDGTFGLSIESGEPILDERLEIVPTAERTAEEQAHFDGG